MKIESFPLKEVSIREIYYGEMATYEIPIYQRNYAWGKDEIAALIQDVYDAYLSNKTTYFIGTLVSFDQGDQVYEIIDGQQRLTTIKLVLHALGQHTTNKLTYRARKKSNDTLASIPEFEVEAMDQGIVDGYQNAITALSEIIDTATKKSFTDYFFDQVHIIHYQVPKDIDLNHYFEIMNSRGEQLEKHEIIKARLIEQLCDSDRGKFNRLWNFCSEMNVYIQQKYSDKALTEKVTNVGKQQIELVKNIFGDDFSEFKLKKFDDLPEVVDTSRETTINELLSGEDASASLNTKVGLDTFQPVIDFSNFLLVVLKITLLKCPDFNPLKFNLDDKELIHEFDKVNLNETFTKKFAFNLLKCKYFLDNYIVHHANEDEKPGNNPWKLQYWQKNNNTSHLKNLYSVVMQQTKMIQLLSMFEVSYSARQRKNYLVYCLVYLSDQESCDLEEYRNFLEKLAAKYFKDIYLTKGNLNEKNTPLPGAFDTVMLKNNKLSLESQNPVLNFENIYGNGTIKSKGVPLYIFNYLDYKLYDYYLEQLRGKTTKKDDQVRKDFFEFLGCSDFDLKLFDQFYFSRTRRSLEHYFPQANADGAEGRPSQAQINCLGNYAMIGSEANSSGSNWSPKAKLVHYLDSSGKIRRISVASLKFMIMMQKCQDNQTNRPNGLEWEFADMVAHQSKMLQILLRP